MAVSKELRSKRGSERENCVERGLICERVIMKNDCNLNFKQVSNPLTYDEIFPISTHGDGGGSGVREVEEKFIHKYTINSYSQDGT
jgi:hypothetical protein